MSFLLRLLLSLTISVIVSATISSGNTLEETTQSVLNNGVQAPDTFGNEGEYTFIYGNKEYHVHIKQLNWFGAWNYCKASHQNLVIIEDTEEYKVLTEYIKDLSELQFFWIGAYNFDTFDKEKFMWVETTSPVKNYRWCAGEPNNAEGVQHCIRLNLHNDNCWDDYDCTGYLNFVCESEIP